MTKAQLWLVSSSWFHILFISFLFLYSCHFSGSLLWCDVLLLLYVLWIICLSSPAQGNWMVGEEAPGRNEFRHFSSGSELNGREWDSWFHEVNLYSCNFSIQFVSQIFVLCHYLTVQKIWNLWKRMFLVNVVQYGTAVINFHILKFYYNTLMYSDHYKCWFLPFRM